MRLILIFPAIISHITAGQAKLITQYFQMSFLELLQWMKHHGNSDPGSHSLEFSHVLSNPQFQQYFSSEESNKWSWG